MTYGKIFPPGFDEEQYYSRELKHLRIFDNKFYFRFKDEIYQYNLENKNLRKLMLKKGIVRSLQDFYSTERFFYVSWSEKGKIKEGLFCTESLQYVDFPVLERIKQNNQQIVSLSPDGRKALVYDKKKDRLSIVDLCD